MFYKKELKEPRDGIGVEDQSDNNPPLTNGAPFTADEEEGPEPLLLLFLLSLLLLGFPRPLPLPLPGPLLPPAMDVRIPPERKPKTKIHD